MTSLKQIEANRLNALKSTGPRTPEGKVRSRQNAVRHGLTAETVITTLENAADYQVFEATIFAEYQPRTASTRELVARLASVLWRLRRCTSIETGLMQIQGELMRSRNTSNFRRRIPRPEWYDEMDVAATSETAVGSAACPDDKSDGISDIPTELGYCFLQANRVQLGAFETLTRYEAALWRQAAQLFFMLQSSSRR